VCMYVCRLRILNVYTYIYIYVNVACILHVFCMYFACVLLVFCLILNVFYWYCACILHVVSCILQICCMYFASRLVSASFQMGFKSGGRHEIVATSALKPQKWIQGAGCNDIVPPTTFETHLKTV